MIENSSSFNARESNFQSKLVILGRLTVRDGGVGEPSNFKNNLRAKKQRLDVVILWHSISQ